MTHRPLLVLVADDSPELTGSLALLLGVWGHEALVANDGAAALALALSGRPDVAILDLAMPGLGGLEVARRLRASPGGPLLWALTGLGSERDRLRCREAGFDAHLLKPADPAELRRLLEAAALTPRRGGRPRCEAGAWAEPFRPPDALDAGGPHSGASPATPEAANREASR